MANRTAWTAGNGVGYTWTTAINGSDLTNLPNGSTVLSSVADITNQTAQDIYADLSVRMTVPASGIGAGAFIALYLCALLDDGVTYGDGSLSSGASGSRALPFAPVGVIPLANATLTNLAGYVQGIVIPPGSFRFALYNSSSVALSSAAANNNVKYRTYNINGNN